MTSFSSYNFPPVNELAFPTEWEPSGNDDKMLFAEEDLLAYHGKTSLSSNTETTNNMVGCVVLGQWEEDDQDMTDAIFQTRPLEELFNNALLFDNDEEHQHYHLHHNTIHDQQGFLAPLLNDIDTTDHDLLEESSTTSIGLPLEERYKATLEKLEASMKRSQETRNCLTMKTVTTESYERVGSVKEILSSIATSSNQVQKYVTSIQRPI